MVKIEFDTFSGGRFPAFKLLGQLCSSSCAERNWSIYKFIHSLKRNKMAPAHAEDLVYVHSNLQLLSRHHEEYVNAAIKMWDIARDSWNESDIHGGLRILENATLTLDELSWRLWLLGMLALVLLLVKVKFEVKLLILMMMMVVFDCLVDYLLFCFSFKLVSCILISEHHGMF